MTADDHHRRRPWRVNWDRLVLVAFVALQVAVVVAMLAAVTAIALNR